MPQDISNLFKEAGFVTKRPVLIETSDFSYTVKSKSIDNWNFHASFAFKKIQASRSTEFPVKTFATIGSGNGVDALCAYYAFPELENVVMTDINRNVIGLCRENFGKNIDRKISYDAYEGFLCEPLIEHGLKADIFYANIPNVPDDSIDLLEGRNSSSFLLRGMYGKVPSEFERYYMVGVYALLKSAKKCLAKNGLVIVNFGGRVPYGLIPKMFRQNGYSLREVCCGFKMQTETEEMLAGYSKGEKEYDVNFDFYLYDKAVELMREKGIANPTSAMKGEKLKQLLAPYKVNSTQSLELFSKGIAIGHTVHLLQGKL